MTALKMALFVLLSLEFLLILLLFVKDFPSFLPNYLELHRDPAVLGGYLIWFGIAWLLGRAAGKRILINGRNPWVTASIMILISSVLLYLYLTLGDIRWNFADLAAEFIEGLPSAGPWVILVMAVVWFPTAGLLKKKLVTIN